MRPKRFYRHMDPMKAEEIRRRYFKREATQKQLASEYGLRQGTVSKIVSGFTWNSR